MRNESESFVLSRPITDFIIVGIDPSLVSSAVTWHKFDLNGNHIESKYLCFPQTEMLFKFLKNSSNVHSSRLSLDVDKDSNLRITRYCLYANEIKKFIIDDNENLSIYISIEDYALRALGRVYPLGEYGGILRYTLLNSYSVYPIYIRETDPITVKLMAGKGSSTKTDMYMEYKKILDSNSDSTANIDLDLFFEFYNKSKKSVSVTETSPFSDIIDSWWIARILKYELFVRWGFLSLKDLDEKVIHILNRTSKSYPVNVLSRSFLRI